MGTDHLRRYREMRDFAKTPEPEGGAPSEGAAPTFVVQKHAATRLHYDVRFEVEGAMPSWAVPKGPSYDPAVKRLAMQTEDHPLDYQTFEGIIPKGEYGGGTVVVWDRGTYRNISEHRGQPLDMRAAIQKGHFSVSMEGTKLRGGWSFTRTARGDNGKDSWIMVKRKDDHADPSRDVEIEEPNSAVTGRSLEEVAAEEGGPEWTRGVATWVPPMLAELSKKVPVGDGWIYERKLDGLRCVAVRNGDDVQLWSRNHLSFNKRFPEIIAALRALPADNFTVDGEIVVYDEDGRTSFTLLQRPGGGKRPVLALFDVMHLLGRDTTGIPLLDRKALLAKLVVDHDTLRLVDHEEGDPGTLLERACAEGWEGLIAKQATGEYRSGRSSEWRKLKCSASQELVIGGWTEPRGARTGFGALLMGYYDGPDLRYAGKVGTGFDNKLLAELYRELEARELDASPFSDPVKEKGAHWARPDLVANIAFTEWTSDGKLRHPRFEGLRPDKAATSVVREQT